jgi:hypothetical protein
LFGSATFAEFRQINNLLFHLSGRITEVACVGVADLSVRRVDEGSYSYDILQCHLKRFKNGALQELPLFPHRDSLFQDSYFSLLYHVLMNTVSGTLVCPAYADATLQGKKEVCESQASPTLKTIANVPHFQLNAKLTSHNGKKGSNQKMAESSAISGLPQIYRSGWTVNNVHTLFDYVLGSAVGSRFVSAILTSSNQAPPLLTNTKMADFIHLPVW